MGSCRTKLKTPLAQKRECRRVVDGTFGYRQIGAECQRHQIWPGVRGLKPTRKRGGKAEPAIVARVTENKNGLPTLHFGSLEGAADQLAADPGSLPIWSDRNGCEAKCAEWCRHL